MPSSSSSKHSLWAKYSAEFVGTYFLVLTIGCNVLTGSIGAAVSVGSILMVMIYSLYSVSGAHFNPAVTIAVKMSGRNILSFRDVIFYILFQLLGGLAAGCTYAALFGGAFIMEPVGKFSATSAFVSETVYSTALCYVVLNVATTQKQANNEYFGLAIGFTVVAAALAIGGVSGCCLNPAVSIAAAAVASASRGLHALKFLHIYIIAPFIGSGIACACFYIVQRADEYNGAQRSTEDANRNAEYYASSSGL